MSATVPLEVQCTHRAPLREESRRRMRLVLAITAAVMVAEAVGGWLAHALARLADAGHMLADVAALGLSLVVTTLAQRPVTAECTFGLLRLEILAALVNGAALIVIALGVGFEAYHRLRSPTEGQGTLLLIIAGGGLVAHAAGTWILHRGHNHPGHQRGDRDERSPRGSKPGRQPACARSRAGLPRGHGHPPRDRADGAGSNLRINWPPAW